MAGRPGPLTAFASGIGAIWIFLRLLNSRYFYYFAYYAWGAGALYLEGEKIVHAVFAAM